MMTRRWFIPLLSILLLAVPLGAQTRPAPEASTVELASPALNFAYSPKSGMVAAAHPETSAVTLYPELVKGSTARAIDVKLPTAPVFVAYKPLPENKGIFLAACPSDSMLYALDEQTGKILNKVALPRCSPHYLAAPSNPTRPYVYVGSPIQGSNRTPLIRVTVPDLSETLRIEGNHRDLSNPVSSADGSILYLRYDYCSPAGLCAVKLAAPRGESISSSVLHMEQNINSQPYIADPWDTSVASGNRLYSPDLERTLATFPDYIIAYHPDLPVVFTYRSDEVTAYSINTYKKLGALSLPQAAEPARRPGGRPAAPRSEAVQTFPQQYLMVKGANIFCTPAGFFDPKTKSLVVAYKKTVRVIPLDSLNYPSEPNLAAFIDGPNALNVGQKSTWKVSRKDAHSTLQLVAAPQGVQLTGDTLSWTPTAADVGTPTISLKITASGYERTLSLSLSIRRPSPELAFVPNMIQLSADGQTALVGRVQMQEQGVDPSAVDLCLLDTVRGTVIAKRKFETPFLNAAFDDNNVSVVNLNID